VDTVGTPATYQALLQSKFPKVKKIIVAKKADSLYPIVSAASICAKVTRDLILEQWEFIEPGLNLPRDFGCGYPSDSVTQKWLKANMDPVFGFPRFIRFSWSTAEKPLTDKGVRVKWYFFFPCKCSFALF
jgi:ribonuclease H2 subunit A